MKEDGMSEQDLLKHLRMRPYSNPSFWLLEAADEIERLRAENQQLKVEIERVTRERDALVAMLPLPDEAASQTAKKAATDNSGCTIDGILSTKTEHSVYSEMLSRGMPREFNEEQQWSWLHLQFQCFAALEAEIERLRAIINAKLHRRRCHDCGHVGWYADSRTPYCPCDRCCSWLCDRCRSWDTRRVKEQKG